MVENTVFLLNDVLDDSFSVVVEVCPLVGYGSGKRCLETVQLHSLTFLDFDLTIVLYPNSPSNTRKSLRSRTFSAYEFPRGEGFH